MKCVPCILVMFLLKSLIRWQGEELFTLGICLLWPAAHVGMQEAEEAPVGCLRGIVQGGAAPAVAQAAIDAGRQQQRCHEHRLPAAGHMQRCEAAGALRVHVGTSLHQDIIQAIIAHGYSCSSMLHSGMLPQALQLPTTQTFSAALPIVCADSMASVITAQEAATRLKYCTGIPHVSLQLWYRTRQRGVARLNEKGC